MKCSLFAALLLSPFALIACSGPEGNVKSHYEKMESIMSKHLDDPVKGVEKLIDYMESHGVELAAAEADLVFSISQIEKDGDRAERIKEVQDELKTVRENLNGTSKKFFKAVMADEKAADQFKGFEERMRDARKVRFGSGLGLF